MHSVCVKSLTHSYSIRTVNTLPILHRMMQALEDSNVQMRPVEYIDLRDISLLSWFKFPKNSAVTFFESPFLGNLNLLSRLKSPRSIYSMARIQTNQRILSFSLMSSVTQGCHYSQGPLLPQNGSNGPWEKWALGVMNPGSNGPWE